MGYVKKPKLGFVDEREPDTFRRQAPMRAKPCAHVDAKRHEACAIVRPTIISHEVRRFLAILIGALVLGHVLLPAQPTYICQAMGGQHMAKPCCPGDAPPKHDERPALRRGRCCDSAPPVAIDSGWAQAQKLDSRAFVPPLDATPIVFALPQPLALRRGARTLARGDPLPVGPPPALHRILRI